jgi:hypothetical protein
MRKIIYKGNTEANIRTLVVAPDDRDDVAKAIDFALNGPVEGPFTGFWTGQSGKHPIHAVTITGTDTRPTLQIYYVPDITVALVVGVKVI